MKKVLCGLALLSFLVLFSASMADELPPMAQELPRIFSGRISEVDSNNRMVVVKSGEEDMVFALSEKTGIKTEYGVSVPFSELKNDMQVTVEYLKEGKSIQPLSIKVSGMRKGFGKKQKEKQKKK